MGLMDNVLNRLGYRKAMMSPAPGWLRMSAESSSGLIPDGSIYDNQADLYRKLSWILIAVQITAQSCAAAELSVHKRRDEELDDITNHPFEVLLKRPNELQSRFELLEATFSYHALNGNAYWWLNRGSASEEPTEIWSIPSPRITPVPSEQLGLKGYIFDTGNGKKLALETWEVVHFKRFNPHSMFVGLSPIEALATVATGDLGMQKVNTNLYTEANGRLSGILAFADPIIDSEWERIKKDVQDKAAKRQMMILRNAGKGGVEWIRTAMSNQEMDYIAERKMNRQEIFDVYAPGLFATLSENATEANSRTAKATFGEFCLWPLLSAAAEKITNDVLPVYGDGLVAEFDNPRNADRSLRIQEQQEYSRSHTIDEVRQKFYGEKELGDERGELLIMQISKAPVQAQGGPPQGDQSQGGQAQADQPQGGAMVDMGNNAGGGANTGKAEGQSGDWRSQQEELKAWERFEVKRVGKAKGRDFECNFTPVETQARIKAGLKGARTVEEVREAFEEGDGVGHGGAVPLRHNVLLEELKAALTAFREAA